MAKRKKPKLDLFAELEEDVDELELIRRGFPELTRCVVCEELFDTERVVYATADGEVLLSVWAHPHCRDYIEKPKHLAYQWDQEPLYRPTKVYPEFTAVQKYPRTYHKERPQRPNR